MKFPLGTSSRSLSLQDVMSTKHRSRGPTLIMKAPQRFHYLNDFLEQRRFVQVPPPEHMELMYDMVETESIQIKLECFLCPFSAYSERDLMEHMALHTGEEKPYRCRKCPYTAARKCHLVCHERAHMGRKPYKCSFCGYSTVHKSNVIVHERNHTGEKPYKCQFCDYRAAQRGNVTVHERKHLESRRHLDAHLGSPHGELDRVQT